jgi:hypothetical protein
VLKGAKPKGKAARQRVAHLVGIAAASGDRARTEHKPADDPLFPKNMVVSELGDVA